MIRLITILFSIGFASIIFAQVPSAQFSVNQVTVCAGFPLSFTDLSNYGGAGVISTNWDFGEGGQSTNTNPTYTYMNPGTYQVLLTVISTGGTDFELKLNYITVYANPTASFTTSGNGCTVPFDATFTNTSTTGAGMTYDWDFGNTQTSSLQNPPVVTYSVAGTYTVTLVVTNTLTGCTTTTTQDIVVSDYSAGIGAPLTACEGEAVSITDGSTLGANSWVWDSGDGQISNSQNPTFTYPAAGTYTISLSSQNSVSGCLDNVTQDITILPLPTPTFTATPTSGCAPLDVTFTNTSGAGTFVWNFGNGATFNGANPPVQTYAANGSYTVSLQMTSANGCVGTTTVNDMITVSPPIASFAADVLNGCAPLAVQFSDQSIASNPVDDPIVSWVWDFGDGSPTFNGQTPPAHVYGIGIFDASLTITTQNGCLVTATIANYIEVGMIDLVDFSLFPINECAKQDITFTNLSVISTPHDPAEVLYTWDFGDGGSSTQEDPIYNYPIDTGMFDIQLIVEFRGCIDTLERTDQIYIKAPISSFMVATLYCNPVSFPVTVNVTDNAIAGAVTDDVDMIWSWGVPVDPDDLLDDPDIFDANQGDTSHAYTAYGSYVIKQVVHNYTTGCTDSTETTIIISSMDAGFVLSSDTVCNSVDLTLTSTSVFTDPDATYSYDMGNGDIATGDPANYIYNVPGSYDIQLVATNAAGCSDSSEFLNFIVLDPPIAALSADDSAGCLPITATFTNLSSVQGNGVPLSSFLWTFPDLTTQTTNNLAETTSFAFTSEGNFFTTLVATDEFGCSSPPATVPMMITIPTVNFNMLPVVCDTQIFTAINTTTGFGPLNYEWYVDDVFATTLNDFTTLFDEVASPLYTNVPHNITLIATDGNGCVDSITQTIRVDLPKADLNYIASGATANAQGEYTCPPVFENYTDSSSAYGIITNWAWDFGDGKTSSFQDPDNTYVFPGVYTLSLSIVDEYGCAADTVLVDYLTILGPQGDLAWTSIGDPCELIYSFTATNLTFVDSIVWDLDDGTTIFDSTAFSHTYAVGSYDPTGTLIDSLGCEVTYPMPVLVVPLIILSSNAGPDQSICGNSTTLAGNVDPFGTGVWTVITGTGIFADSSIASTDVTGIGLGLSQYVWTVTNACDTISDTLEIFITDSPTLPSAGPDQFLCASATSLAGNTPLVGVGTWTLVGGTGTITDPSDPLTGITGMAAGVNQFVWTIANFCSSVGDTVSIIVEIIPTVANAGPDQTICDLVATLAGNIPLEGNGTWTVITGTSSVTDPTNPLSGVTALTLGTNRFVWTIANSCGTTSDTITIIRVSSPTLSSAGPDQFTCLTDATLAGNEVLIGVGNWTLISGTGVISDITDSTATVTGLSIGPNVFEWINISICGNSSDQVTITVETTPTIADAGPDVTICGTTIDLAANTPVEGTGMWTIISGSGIIANPFSPTVTVTGLDEGPNIFEWSIANSCDSTTDQVTITSVLDPPISDAGPDQIFCGSDGILAGNDPSFYTGTWTLISGTGVISNPTDSASTISDLGIGDNIFLWTISNICSTNSDQVIITIEDTPTTANAGPDQVICTDVADLQASPVIIGTGIWTLISGSGSIANVTSPTSALSNLGIGANIFQWTVSNTCGTTADQVVITQFEQPTVASAGPDQSFCGGDSTSTVLVGITPLIGNGFWSIFSGSGTITDPTNPNSAVTGLGLGQNVFQWTIANGCGSTLDQVTITIEAPPVVAVAGPDTVICGGNGILDGNSALLATGTWTLVSGAGSINTVSDSTSGVNNLGIGDNVFEWVIANSCGSSSDQMTITNTGECPDEDSLASILYFYVPNTFTPNGDIHNQIFQPQFTQGYEPLLFTLYIFNRWGELIFESHDADVGWKGTYGTGNEQVLVQDDTYTWKIIFTDKMYQKEHTVVGHVNMVR